MHTTTTSPTGTHTHGHPRNTPPNHRGTHGSKTRHTFRRFAAGAAAVALAATGAIAAAPGTAAADTHRDGQWYLDDFNINKVHELSQGEGVKIGVIDTGFDPNHPDLEGNIEEGAEFDENGKTDGNAHTDDSGHGTAVTSVLAGHGHGKNNADGILGIAPKATIIPAKVDFEEGKFAQGSPEFTHAFEWLISQDVNIISISLGSGSDPESNSQIDKALAKGISIVSSAGNVTTSDAQWGEITNDHISWPATIPGVIPVAGTNQDHQFWEGSVNLEGAPTQPQLGLSAPATNIPMARPNNKYATYSGTSLATPIVAGTLALMKSAYPDLDLYTQQSRLLETVDDKGKKGFDDKYGWGIVNPYKALTEETTFTDADGNDTVSSPDDRLPLNEQGDPVSNVPPPDAVPPPDNTPDLGDKHKDEAATEAPGPPTWLTITIIATGALLTAALITLVITKTRRSKKPAPPPGTGPLPPGHPGGPTPPPQHNPDQAPPPHAYGAPTAPAPGGAQPHTPQTPPHPAGQPDPAPPTPHSPGQPGHTPQQNAGQAPPNPPGPGQPGQPDPAATPPPPQSSPWQPPHDPNTNPPPHQPPQ